MQTQELAVWKEVDLDDMQCEAGAGVDGNDDVYSYACRCGGRFCVPVADLEAGFAVHACPSCSLNLKVLFEADSEEEGEELKDSAAQSSES
jgi:hypothetical protein